MALIKTPRAIIDILDAARKVTGHEIEYTVTYEPEGAGDPLAGLVQPSIKREVATLANVQALRDQASDTLVRAHTNLNTQLADERTAAEAEKSALRTQLAEALAAKDAVIAAKEVELEAAHPQ